MSGRPWWNLEPCGTDSAYKRHMRRREKPCQRCREAHAAVERWRMLRLRRSAA